MTEKQEKDMLVYLSNTLQRVEVSDGVFHYVIEDLIDFMNKFINKLKEEKHVE